MCSGSQALAYRLPNMHPPITERLPIDGIAHGRGMEKLNTYGVYLSSTQCGWPHANVQHTYIYI